GLKSTLRLLRVEVGRHPCDCWDLHSPENHRMTEPEASPAGSRHVHIPVLLKEVLQNLQLEPGLIVVDGTVGAAGHSSQIFSRIQPGGTLIGLDRDALMLEKA